MGKGAYHGREGAEPAENFRPDQQKFDAMSEWGASAGGGRLYRSYFQNMPVDTGRLLLLSSICHPDAVSLMDKIAAEILQTAGAAG